MKIVIDGLRYTVDEVESLIDSGELSDGQPHFFESAPPWDVLARTLVERARAAGVIVE